MARGEVGHGFGRERVKLVTFNNSSLQRGRHADRVVELTVCMQSPCDLIHFLMSPGREEQAKNFMIFFSIGSFFLAAGIVFAASLTTCSCLLLQTGLQHCCERVAGHQQAERRLALRMSIVIILGSAPFSALARATPQFVRCAWRCLRGKLAVRVCLEV